MSHIKNYQRDEQPSKKSAAMGTDDSPSQLLGDQKPLNFVRRGSLDPADLYAPMYQSHPEGAFYPFERRGSKGDAGMGNVHIEGEMERTLHKTERHHPDISFTANDSDVGGQDDI